MAMIKIEFKICRKTTEGLCMSKMMKDIMSIEEKPEQGTKDSKSVVLMFEEIDIKENKIIFMAKEKWDVKENLLELIEHIEGFSWVHSIENFKKSKAT